MREYICIRAMTFNDSDIPPVEVGTLWVEPYENRPDNYVHLEQNGNPGDWLEMPEEEMERYFKEIKE